MGRPVGRLAAHGLESRRWTEGVDPWTCQTFAATPAEPGGSFVWLEIETADNGISGPVTAARSIGVSLIQSIKFMFTLRPG
jgi:hypothetical protein